MTLGAKPLARYSGLATVTIEWLAFALYYLRAPAYFSGEYPISYFRTLPETRWIFIGCYMLANISCWVFIKYHLTQHYAPPKKVFGASLLFFVATAIYPFNFDDRTSSTIHICLVLSGSLLFLLSMHLMARHSDDKRFVWATHIAITVSFALVIAYTRLSQGSHLILPLETGSWLAVQIWMIWLTAHTWRREASTQPQLNDSSEHKERAVI